MRFDPGTIERRFSDINPTFTRRVLAKAAAGFAAAAAFTGSPVRRERAAIAQDTSTRAGQWVAPDGIGGDGAYFEFIADHPFRAIAPHWSGENGVYGAVEIAVSPDGVTWTTPAIVGPALADAGPADRDGRIFGQLMMTEPAQHVRCRVFDGNGNATALPGLAFTYIDATAGPGLEEVQPVAFGGALTQPPIITRDQWGAHLAYDGWDAGTDQWQADYKPVEHIIIHHSETPNFRDPLIEIRSIHYYHAVTRGWGDIGYNFLVDYLGNVYEGRKGGENVVGGHAFQYAHGSVGVCSMGSFSLQTSTPEAIGALVWISAWAGRHLDPLGFKDFHETPNLPTIAGHRDVNSSTCPGDSLYADLPYIRQATAEVLAGARDAGIPTDYAAGEVIEVTVDQANLRTRPGTGAPVAMELPGGTVLTIVEGPTTTDDHTWYRVSGQSTAGWLASSTFGRSAAPPPPREYGHGTRVEVATDLLNIRNAPGIAGAIVGTLPQGDVATVVGGPEHVDNAEWIKVDTNVGSGWVTTNFVAPSGRTWIASAFARGDTVRVNTDRLNMRTDATEAAPLVAQLWKDSTAVVVGGPRRTAGNTWLEVTTDQGTGWVVEKHLAEAAAPPPPPPRFGAGARLRVDTDALNLRQEARLGAPVVTILWTGEEGTVVGDPVQADNYTWYQLETGRGTGWGVETFLAEAASAAPPASGFEPGTAVTVTTDAVNLRTEPTVAAPAIRTLFNAEAGSVVGASAQADDYTWVQATFGPDTGWVATAYIGRTPAAPAATSGLAVGGRAIVTDDHLNVRPEPALTTEVLGQLFKGAVAQIVEGPVARDGHTWYRVDSDVWDGWVTDGWLLPESGSDIPTGASVRVFGGELNMRGGPGTDAGVSGILPDGAIVEVLEGPQAANGYAWYRVSSSRYGSGWAVSAWMERV